MRTIEEHQAVFAQAGADGYRQAEAFGEAMTDLIDARAEVERLTKFIDRLHVQAQSASNRLEHLPARYVESEGGGDFCALIGHMAYTAHSAKAGKALP